jgi:hypothetical protein
MFGENCKNKKPMYLAKQTNILIISSCEKMVTQGKNIHSLKLKWQSLNIEIFFSWSSFDKILLTFNKIIHNRPNQKNHTNKTNDHS